MPAPTTNFNLTDADITSLQTSLNLGSSFAIVVNLDGTVTLAIGSYGVASTPSSDYQVASPGGNGTAPQGQVTVTGKSSDIGGALFLSAWFLLAQRFASANAANEYTITMVTLQSLAESLATSVNESIAAATPIATIGSQIQSSISTYLAGVKQVSVGSNPVGEEV